MILISITFPHHWINPTLNLQSHKFNKSFLILRLNFSLIYHLLLRFYRLSVETLMMIQLAQ